MQLNDVFDFPLIRKCILFSNQLTTALHKRWCVTVITQFTTWARECLLVA